MLARIVDENTIHVDDLSQFDAGAILSSGQVFRWHAAGDNRWFVKAGGRSAEIRTGSLRAVIKGDADFWWNFFDLGTDYNEIKKELAKFKFLRGPIAAGGGIRILRQPFAETVISFIISANNNIKRFTKTIEQIDFDLLDAYTEEDFKNMGCGYRAPYLVKTIAQLNIGGLPQLDSAALIKALSRLHGVGPKVACCVALFCGDFHRLDVMPVDTWIAKGMNSLTGQDKAALASHKYAGVAQQYIFYYLQHLKKELQKSENF